MGTWRMPRAIERSTLSTPFIFHHIINLSLPLHILTKLITKPLSSLSLGDHHLLHIHICPISFFFLDLPLFFAYKPLNNICTHIYLYICVCTYSTSQRKGKADLQGISRSKELISIYSLVL